MPVVPLPGSLASRAFTTREALHMGLSREQLRRRSLVAPHHGVRSPGRAVGPLARARDALPLLRPDEAFCHLTALELWDLPVPLGGSSTPPVVHVGGTVSRQRRRPGLRTHRYGHLPVLHHGGLPLVAPVEAWLQSAADLAVDELVIIGDALCGAWSPWPAARGLPRRVLVEAVAGARSRPGAPRLRAAVRLVREGVLSPQETRLRLLVVRHGTPEPEVNVPRHAPDGSYLGRPDLSWPSRRVALEYEGDQHRTDRRLWRSDIDRRERFADGGWYLMRASADDLVAPGDAAFLARLDRRLR